MGKQFYTYIHCKPNGDPFYVGKGCDKRAFNFYRRNRHHKAIVEKYGKDKIGVFIFPCDSEREAFDTEIRDIAQLRQDGFDLVNVVDGGQGVSGRRWKATDAQRLKLSIAGIGNKRALGWKHTQESIGKLSAALKNRAGAKETVERLREINRIPVVCVETGEVFFSAKIAAAKVGKSREIIGRCCRGQVKSVGGYTFKYLSSNHAGTQ